MPHRSIPGNPVFAGINCRECRTAHPHDITVENKNRVYFTASILTVQWLAHTRHWQNRDFLESHYKL